MPNTTTDTEVNELIINTLTKAQYDELVANNQINENELYLTKDEEYITPFEVVYNTTTYAAITSALTAKQEPVCNYNNYHYVYAGKDSTYYYLTCAINSEIKYVRVNSSNTWSNGTAAIPQGTVTSVRVQAGTGLSSSTSTAQTTSLDTTISIASGYKLPTTTEWNGKQDALTTQTAYSAKGSATKVPQITTNTLGQVTAITEVTITQPTVNNSTITIQKNGTNVDSFTTNASSNKSINITLAKGDVGLGNVDNTSDANKPISTATQTALDAKANKTNIINGAPLSNTSSYFFATSDTAAATVQKEVSIPSITELNVGQIIIVKPTVTSTVANSTIKLNNFDAYPMRYNNAAITTSTDSVVWSASYPSIWVFDGTYWLFAGHGVDSNTTYSNMSVAEGTTGTATSQRTMRADYLKQIIHGTVLTGLDTTTATVIDATDTILSALGKLQAQIDEQAYAATFIDWE